MNPKRQAGATSLKGTALFDRLAGGGLCAYISMPRRETLGVKPLLRGPSEGLTEADSADRMDA